MTTKVDKRHRGWTAGFMTSPIFLPKSKGMVRAYNEASIAAIMAARSLSLWVNHSSQLITYRIKGSCAYTQRCLSSRGKIDSTCEGYLRAHVKVSHRTWSSTDFEPLLTTLAIPASSRAKNECGVPSVGFSLSAAIIGRAWKEAYAVVIDMRLKVTRHEL